SFRTAGAKDRQSSKSEKRMQNVGSCADRIKLLWWDGQGFCLFYKILERGYFPWPTAKDGVAHLTQAQLSMLVEGIDWRRPAWTSAPGRMG
ncbi:IS66 family insertion sequence element accessory protein TnpB, partial [Sinorhizobium meliloti]|nr:IS66 family insertion sequence element accessory protein TnpB [Sinorhizobium meliloti]MDX0253360.1 IS66 family insertion sequence element accessory protein TnpB [Sinorhizobium meliloti]MDX1017159.1 IS66 family insertion sequence element accessory protein TnpB [Sinorhizobium medicae]